MGLKNHSDLSVCLFFQFKNANLSCFVLFCFVLFCFVLFCFVLFCFVLFCFVLFCVVLFCLCFVCVLFRFVSLFRCSVSFRCFVVLFRFVLFCFGDDEAFQRLSNNPLRVSMCFGVVWQEPECAFV